MYPQNMKADAQSMSTSFYNASVTQQPNKDATKQSMKKLKK
jgi:hypothetical protein